MKIPPALQVLSAWLIVAVLGTALSLTRADAVESPEPADLSATTTDAPSVTSLDAADEPDVQPATSSQCASGYFCVWSQAQYTGAIQRFKTQSQYQSIYLPSVGSFYNNRSKRVYLYTNGSGTPSACYGPNTKRATVSGSLTGADGTYLSTATSC